MCVYCFYRFVIIDADSSIQSKKYPVDSWNEEHCRKVVDAAIGAKTKYDILSFRPWILSRKVAKSYRDGRVFLSVSIFLAFPFNLHVMVKANLYPVLAMPLTPSLRLAD